MALPKQVQAQLAEVEELEKTLSTRSQEPQEAQAAAEGDQPRVVKEDAETEAKKPDAEAKQDAKPKEVKPADKSTTDVADDFEQKYKTLRGKYDAEVPRLHQQVRDLTEQVAALTSKAETKQPEQPTKPKEKVSYVTDADREEFGEELIDVQRRVAREVAEEYQDKLEAQAKVIEDLRTKVADTDGQVGQMSFAQRLDRLVPDFDAIDADPRWVEWLNEHDPMLRGPRRAQAQKAFNAGDAEAVADYVKLFKASIAEPTEQPRDTRQSELEKQVAPNRSANTSRTPDSGKSAKTYSAREVEAAWNKIRVLNTKGKQDEAAKLEAEITAAYLEGRVQH